ncbi:MAG: transcriptional regulator [Verrucomicrobiae bacterium]|nr:transcriptional regulator [Verrucomicrobiae bacterium]NNJ42431.1 transcriptional regulator [Akkermansiaceae bacterium]
MNNIPLKKVTLIAERLLKEKLLDLIQQEGATGHTLTACEGEGSRGVHASDWEGRNIQIDTIVSAETADRILNRVGDQYMENYAVIAYLSEVSVLRRGKFSHEA